jgi:hypothetical protein
MSHLMNKVLPGLKEGWKILGSELAGMAASSFANTYFVDGDDGSDNNSGVSPDDAFATIQAAVTAASELDTIIVKANAMSAGASDPVSYEENIIIPAGKSLLRIIGDDSNRTQCGLPQIKVGSTTTQALLIVRSPGVSITNIGFNGAGATGGGIVLDDDATTKSAAGVSIVNCHFKNCKGTTATNAATGGAIQWSANGGAWQVRIAGNRFYKNVGDVVLIGTSVSVPQDVVIEDNVFSGPAANVDCHLFLKGGGSGMNGVAIRNNVFPCFPAIGSGTNAKNLDLTGCVGSLTGNTFGITGKTFGAAGNNLVPTTVLMADNYQECAAAASGEIGRT